jgi:hypothetical protein
MFHGGAFVMGSHDTPFVLQLLASIAKQTGIICVSANYRKVHKKEVCFAVLFVPRFRRPRTSSRPGTTTPPR